MSFVTETNKKVTQNALGYKSKNNKQYKPSLPARANYPAIKAKIKRHTIRLTHTGGTSSIENASSPHL